MTDYWPVIAKIRAARLFDDEFYLAQCVSHHVEGLDSSLTLIEHYLLEGYKYQLDPCPDFDARFYLDTYSDVASAGTNPLLHYVTIGLTERRATRGSGAGDSGYLAIDNAIAVGAPGSGNVRNLAAADPDAPLATALPISFTGFDGCLESIDRTGLRGWVYGSGNPAVPVEIAGYIDERFIGRATANEQRGDVEGAGDRDGRFALALPEVFFDDTEHEIDVRIAGTATSLLPRPLIRKLQRQPIAISDGD